MMKLIQLFILFAAAPALMAQSMSQLAAANDVLRTPGGNLHQAARVAGGYYRSTVGPNDGWIGYPDLQALNQESDVAVVGAVVYSASKLDPSPRDLSTHYRVRVEFGIKGRFKTGDIITVVLPGGMVSWEDGTTAEITAPDYLRLTNGSRYLLYLHSRPGMETFATTGRSQGIIGLRDDGTVDPHARIPGPGLRRLRELSHNDLIEAARRAAESDHPPDNQ